MHESWLAAVGGALLAIAGGLLPATAADALLPPGPGRARVAAVCTSCHGARVFAQLREGPRGWHEVVEQMVLHGAEVTPGDIGPIIDYLSASFGPGVPLPEGAPAKVILPNGRGKGLVSGVCALCHGLDRIAAAKRSRHGWDQVVARMESYGAPLSPAQVEVVVSYLDRHFGAK